MVFTLTLTGGSPKNDSFCKRNSCRKSSTTDLICPQRSNGDIFQLTLWDLPEVVCVDTTSQQTDFDPPASVTTSNTPCPHNLNDIKVKSKPMGSGVATLLVEDIPNFAGAAGPRQKENSFD